MRFAPAVSIVEVGPRDGLQSLSRTYATDEKVAMVTALMDAGLRKIEVTGFVRPDVVPQLSDAEELLRRLPRRPGCTLRALVPNRRGTERALGAGVDELLGLITASETYNLKNQRMTIERNLSELEGMAALAAEADVPMVVGIGLALFCPYEGPIPHARALEIVERLAAVGVGSCFVATSVGLDGPRELAELCGALLSEWPGLDLGVHLHDTNGMALANALAAMDAGVTTFEGSICGLGGGIRMPRGLPHCGNVATEDLVHMFAEADVETGLELARVAEAARRIAELLELGDRRGFAARGATRADALRAGRERPALDSREGST